MIYALGERRVKLIGDGHFIAPNAAVIGDVTLEENVSIWFGVTVRGDAERIVIGAGSNVQDGSVLHADPGLPLRLGRGVTIGHQAMVHGCSVGDYSLIGIQAVVLNGAVIGRHCLIAAGALVPEGMTVPDGSVVMGMPGRVRRELDDAGRAGLEQAAESYVQNGQRFLRELRADGGEPSR